VSTWVYIQSESGPVHSLWTVGFYAPDDTWHTDSDHMTPEKAAARVHYLNGCTHMTAGGAPCRCEEAGR
jgi:hypothetical protein